MSRLLPIALTVALLLSLSLFPASAQWVTPTFYEGPASLPTGDDQTTSSFLPTFNFTSVLQSVLSTYNIPGGVVALISLPTQPSASNLASSLLSPAPVCPFLVHGLSAAGVRRVNSPVPVQVSDSFHHGSNTKAMTAVLVAQWVERGRLRFNSTLQSIFPYLPWSDGSPHSPLNSSAGYFAASIYGPSTVVHSSWHYVTLQHLLTHQSGLNNAASQYSSYQQSLYTLEASMPEPDLYRINASNPNPHPIPSRQWLLSHLLAAPLTSPPPGVNSPSPQGYSYSNYNYDILGCVLEELEGRAWELVIQADLFTPLHMLSAGFGPPEIGPYNTATPPAQPWPHYMGSGAWQPIGLNSPYNAVDNPEALAPSGALHMSLIDWARLTACHLQEGAGEADPSAEPAQFFLHPATWRAIHQPFVFPATGAVSSYALSAYYSTPPFPAGWGDTSLSHDGSNEEWYSRSALYLHGSHPFAVLAAFNAAPTSISQALTDLFNAVEGNLTRWLDQQRTTALAPFVNPAVCPALPTTTTFVNSPITLSTGTWVCAWSVGTVYFTPVVVTNSTYVTAITVYPYTGNPGAYNVTLALYSKDGLLLGQGSPTSFLGSQYNDGSTLKPFTVALTQALLLANDTYYASLYYDQTVGNTLLLFAYPTPLIYYVTLPASTTYSSVGGNLSLVHAERGLYGAGEWSYAALVKLTGNPANCSASSTSTVAPPPPSPPLQTSSVCFLTYGLPGNVDFPWSVATQLTVSYSNATVTTDVGAAVQLLNGTGVRTFTNRFGRSYTTPVSLSTTAVNLLYLGSPAPLHGNSMTLNLGSAVQLPGVGPSTTFTSLQLYNSQGVLLEGASALIDAAGQAFTSTIPGLSPVTLGASNVNSLAVSYAACQAPISFTNGLRTPTQPSASNGATTVHWSYYLSDGATYSVVTNLTLSTSSAFATSQDLLGNPYQAVTGVTGTRLYTHLATGATVSSQVAFSATGLTQRLYPYSLLASAPGVYTVHSSPFLDAEGLTFSISPTAPSLGLAPGTGTQLSVITVHVVSQNQTAPQLLEAVFASTPVAALQQQQYSLS